MIKRAALTVAVAALITPLTACTEQEPASSAEVASAAAPAKVADPGPAPTLTPAPEITSAAAPGARQDARSRDRGNAAPRPAREPIDRSPKPLNLGSTATGLETGAPRPGAAPTEADPATFPVKLFPPKELNLGAIPIGDQGLGTITLTNTGDKPMHLTECKRSCGCTAVTCPDREPIEPGETVKVEISLQGGRVPPGRNSLNIRKKVTFIFEDNQALMMDVVGETLAFVEPDPLYINPNESADGALTLKARDGQAFSITSMEPELIDAQSFPATPAAEHVVHFDWEKWKEMGSPKKVFIEIDHPSMKKVTANIRQTKVREPRERPTEPEVPALQADQGMLPFSAVERAIVSGRGQAIAERIEAGRIATTLKNRAGTTLLDVAARHGEAAIAKALIAKGAEVDAADVRGHTPLMTAVQHKQAEVAKILLENGASIEATDVVGSALSWAAGFGDGVCTRLLLEAGAALEVKGEATGYTPLVWAAAFGQLESLEALIEAGADLEATDTSQRATPIMHAARVGHLEKIERLVAAGAELDATDGRQRTALLVAAESAAGTVELARLLVEAGANIKATDAAGRNALDIVLTRKDANAAGLQAYLEERLVVGTPKRVDDD